MAVRADTVTPASAIHVPLRYITAASVFDGHDAAINIIRRLLQVQGCEVIHLGHNRSVAEVVQAALQEDVDGIAVSSYQGGHMAFFALLVDRLREYGAGHVHVFAGGGGTISADDAAALEGYGVRRVYLPEHGDRLGLDGMVRDLIEATERRDRATADATELSRQWRVSQGLSRIELGLGVSGEWRAPGSPQSVPPCPVVGVTGTGGSGKSSLIDELLYRLLAGFPDLHIALLAIDPTRHKSGGALLGDRIRINNAHHPRVFMRSMATRRRHLATSAVLRDCLAWLRFQGFGLIVVETAGTGQGDSEIVDLVDLSLYVMTSDFGSPGQLEKIDMLDFADLVVLNKSDQRAGPDALRDIRKQWRRNHDAFAVPEDHIPVYATTANRFKEAGVLGLFTALCGSLEERYAGYPGQWLPIDTQATAISASEPIIPPARQGYLAEVSASGRAEHDHCEQQARLASRAWGLYQSLATLSANGLPEPLQLCPLELQDEHQPLRQAYNTALQQLMPESLDLLRGWPELCSRYRSERYTYPGRGQDFSGDNYTESLSHLAIPKVALPPYRDWGEILRFLMRENLPGYYPYTAGVFPYRRTGEEPTRMFAGEGGPERTNRRFHFLARGQPATRLSTAFDPLVLYGEDPEPHADSYGCLGMSGVSVATLDDMKVLYSGFDLCKPDTSVSMTINGPAPIVLAWFMNTAIDQQVEKYLRETGQWRETERKIARLDKDSARAQYRGVLPPGHDGLGLGLLGVSGGDIAERGLYRRIRADVLATVRGTVQADILKEDQAQNECIFAVEFALRMMGDVQAFFVANKVRNYYSVSVSGYHIAEAGANPVTQLAFTLTNGFTLVEYYLSRGMAIDDIAPQMSFFFSNGMDPEYAVIGRVARRIWARAMRRIYHAEPRGQRLKYHIQTSGRSLHAREFGFNDSRTTLQALYAIYDNCNSLHTNAYDEAVTTPTEESVRRALAIQLIINRELGLNYNQNPLQGSFIIEQLTELVEEAVYQEFDRLSERGGVLAAMETLYQRGRIQEQSLHYEQRKLDGSLPIVGINTFLREDAAGTDTAPPPRFQASAEEKAACIQSLRLFKQRHGAHSPVALRRLQSTVLAGGNIFDELLDTVRHCTLGQITHALYGVGGQYRRRM